MPENKEPRRRGSFPLPRPIEEAYRNDEFRREKCSRQDYHDGFIAGLGSIRDLLIAWLEGQPR